MLLEAQDAIQPHRGNVTDDIIFVKLDKVCSGVDMGGFGEIALYVALESHFAMRPRVLEIGDLQTGKRICGAGVVCALVDGAGKPRFLEPVWRLRNLIVVAEKLGGGGGTCLHEARWVHDRRKVSPDVVEKNIELM